MAKESLLKEIKMHVFYRILFRCIKKNPTLLTTGGEHKKSLLVQVHSLKQINTKNICYHISKFLLRCSLIFLMGMKMFFEYYNSKGETMHK